MDLENDITRRLSFMAIERVESNIIKNRPGIREDNQIRLITKKR